ncbi:MAG: hypothetical protein JWR50_2472 [Mucilaginibacter sp.]|nr:hypothetical protein [Mucilaginibacter sp.]
MDATEYLLSTKANKERLDAAIKEVKDGKGVEIKLKDLWAIEFEDAINEVNLAKQGKITLKSAEQLLDEL